MWSSPGRARSGAGHATGHATINRDCPLQVQLSQGEGEFVIILTQPEQV